MTATHHRAPLSARPRFLAAVAGFIGAAVSLAIGELFSGISRAMPSLVIAVAELFVDKTPGNTTETAIRAVGTNDKPILIAGVAIGALLVGTWVGVKSRRNHRFAIAAFSGFGLFGAWAAARNPFATTGWAWLSALVAASVGAAVTIGLLRVFDGLPEPATVTPTPVSLSARRAFLVYSSGAAVGALAATAVGKALRGRQSVADERAAIAARSASTSSAAGVTGIDTFDSIEGLSPYVTPTKDFYRIDTALTLPQVNPNNWVLKIGGMVDAPFQLTYDELVALPQEEHLITLSCVSNEIGGPLVGNARFKGVPLTALLDRAGVQPAGRQIVGRSVDGFTAGFPTEVAYDGRHALVAVTMNGEPLPIRHGFPARLVVPGLYGYVSAVKWLKEITLETEDFNGYWIPRGWSKLGPMKTMSRIDVPRARAGVAAGTVAVAGVAWSPTRGVARVEVKIDDAEWQTATLAPAVSDETWVQWRYPWNATRGKHTLAVRAFDMTGAVQPIGPADPRPDGAEGYHTITVDVR